MIDRINLILKAKNITARQFAEEIGIQPSGMSHIMSGRNNPSLEFVNKVVRRYPEIDANWLIMGKGEMYGTAGIGPAGSTPAPSFKERGMESVAPTLFSDPEPSPIPEAEPVPAPESVVEEPVVVKEPAVVEQPVREVAKVEKKPSPAEREGRRLVKIMLFYDDHTFEEYRPE